jgi:hypothetical protein
MASAKNSHDAGPLGAVETRKWKFENGNSKLETGNRKLDTALNFEFPVSSFEFSLTPKVREDGGKKKNITNEPNKLLKTKDHRTN